MSDLKPNLAEVKKLLGEMASFFRDKGIIVKSRVNKKENAAENVQNSKWIKHFLIQPVASAFYLQINSSDDIKKLNDDLTSDIEKVQSNLSRFLDTNNDLEDDLKNKVNNFISILENAKMKVQNGLKRSLRNACKNCIGVEELCEKAGEIYANFIKEDILETILYPLYYGLRRNPNEDSYIYVVKTMNQFLEKLGVMTIPIDEGDLWKETGYYKLEPSEEQKDEYKTSNENEKDIVKAILRYAYAFQEDKGEDNRPISDGKVIVMVYQP